MTIDGIQSSDRTLTPVVLNSAPVNRQGPASPGNAEGAASDDAGLSATAVLLIGLEYQLSISTPSGFQDLLEIAASRIHSAAGQVGSHEQSSVLEHIADRLHFAASTTGLSSRTPLSLASFV
jgi:hypothetical protein